VIERARHTRRVAAVTMKRRTRRTFSSLKVRNYRLYFIGQTISLCGTWMQSLAMGLLVLQLSHASGTALGLVMGLQCAPILLLAPYGGVLADRFPKRRLLVITQTAAGLLALTLGVLIMTGAVRLWVVYLFALCLGIITAIDNPTRQTFAHELVGRKQLGNAVSLNSIIVNLSRVVGPALAGLVVAQLGLAPCFIINGLSFGAVLACLAMMRDRELIKTVPVKAAKGQLRDGFGYAWKTPIVRDLLIMTALVGTFTYEFSVSLPLLAHVTFAGTEASVAASVALLMSAMGVGAVLGGLVTAGKRGAGMRALTFGVFGFGGSMLLVAVSPTLPWACVAMGVAGYFSVSFTAYSNTMLQVTSSAKMRGRVMALWAMGFIGLTVVGGPIIGWVGEMAGPRLALAAGAAGSLAAGLVGMRSSRAHAAQPLEAANLPVALPSQVRESA
jgi:MFS family permease